MIKIEIVKKILYSLKEVEFAYLFGSYAKNTFTQNSDIDIALYLKQDNNTFDTKLKIHHKLEIRLNMEVDLLILNKHHEILDYKVFQRMINAA